MTAGPADRETAGLVEDGDVGEALVGELVGQRAPDDPRPHEHHARHFTRHQDTPSPQLRVTELVPLSATSCGQWVRLSIPPFARAGKSCARTGIVRTIGHGVHHPAHDGAQVPDEPQRETGLPWAPRGGRAAERGRTTRSRRRRRVRTDLRRRRRHLDRRHARLDRVRLARVVGGVRRHTHRTPPHVLAELGPSWGISPRSSRAAPRDPAAADDIVVTIWSTRSPRQPVRRTGSAHRRDHLAAVPAHRHGHRVQAEFQFLEARRVPLRPRPPPVPRAAVRLPRRVCSV